MKIFKIELPKEFGEQAGLQFLRVEMSAEYATPFALVRYALKGAEQENGVSIDLQKRAFLEHFENPERDRFARNLAPAITTVVTTFLAEHPRPSRKFEPKVERLSW